MKKRRLCQKKCKTAKQHNDRVDLRFTRSLCTSTLHAVAITILNRGIMIVHMSWIMELETRERRESVLPNVQRNNVAAQEKRLDVHATQCSAQNDVGIPSTFQVVKDTRLYYLKCCCV